MSILQRLRFFRDVLAVDRSAHFDAGWYLTTYPDVAATDTDAAVHFLSEGWRAGLDPGPEFSTSWYLEQNPNVWAAGINPLLHYLRGGAAEGREPNPRWMDAADADEPTRSMSLGRLIRDGSLLLKSLFTADLVNQTGASVPIVKKPRHVRGLVESRSEGLTVLVCAHASGRQLYGAERSFLDVLQAMMNLGFNVIATLPTPNPEYEKSVARLCSDVFVFAYPQWSKDFSEIAEVVGTFEKIVTDCRVDVVHANTIMPREVLTAARRLGKVSIVHAREIISMDDDLAAAIGQPSATIVSMVLDRADAVIANSAATASCYGDSRRVFVVRNCVDTDQLDIPNTVDPSSVCIALVGSNTRKKGIEDFIELAECLEGRVGNARLLVIGSRPETAETRWNMRPENLVYAGYQDRSVDAISQTNIVVNLSRIPESFGRTVAEAMAARRPVIAYQHGAVPELIRHGETGFLVPPGDLSEVAAHIEWLCANPERISEFGESGRRYAMAEFAPEVAQNQLATAYGRIASQN